MGPAQANMRALSQKYELPLPFSNSTALIRLTSRETMTKTKNEQPKMPEKPSHLSAEQDTRNRSPDNTGPAIPTEQQPHEAANHTPTASDASGSHTTGNSSQETASSSPYLGGSLFAGPQDMLRDIFADAHHKIPSKSIAEYCTLSVVLTMVVYHVLSYFIESRLTVATLLAFWLLVLTTHDPSEQHNILGAFPYFAGHGIAFMYDNIHSGFIDRRSRRSPILSLRRTTAYQHAIQQATNDITMRLPELVNMARKHAPRPEDKSALDKAASSIEMCLDDLFDLVNFDLARLNADTKNDRDQHLAYATSLRDVDRGVGKSPQTPANKSAGAAQWFQSKGSSGHGPGFPVPGHGGRDEAKVFEDAITDW
jgi:hypothetical protein